MGLRAYIDEADLLKALEPFGEIKGEVIRLKYKADHDLAGLENGNRLVRMVLSTPSIPYLLKIADEWCRIIHNNQQPVCPECSQLGHSRRKCPTIKCNLCKATGHMSMDCDKRFDSPPPREQQTEALTTMPEKTQEHQTDTTPPKQQRLSSLTHTLPLWTALQQNRLPRTSHHRRTHQTTSLPPRWTVQFPSNGATLQTLTRITPLTNLYCDVPEWPLNPTSQLREAKPPPLLETINGL